MNILKKFEVKDMGERIRSDFNKLFIGFSTQVEEISNFPTDHFRKVYEYSTWLRVRFTANEADYDMALENVKKLTQQHVYNDVLIGLQMIQSCVYNGDAHSALKEIDALRSLIMDIE